MAGIIYLFYRFAFFLNFTKKTLPNQKITCLFEKQQIVNTLQLWIQQKLNDAFPNSLLWFPKINEQKFTTITKIINESTKYNKKAKIPISSVNFFDVSKNWTFTTATHVRLIRNQISSNN